MDGIDLEQVFEAMIDGVIVVNAGGEIERINAAARRILGVRGGPDALLGTPIDQLPHAELFVSELQRTLQEGSSRVVHGRLFGGAAAALGPRESGSSTEPSAPSAPSFAGWGLGHEESRVVDLESVPVLSRSGDIEGAALTLRDATIGASLREAREAQHRDRVFGRMAAGIAHEVKNPLGGIRGAAELLARQSENKRALRRAELIISEVDRITTLIDDFMVFTHDRLRLEEVNVHRVLDDVLAVVEHDPRAAGLEFVRHFDPSIPELRADPDRLHQLFLNLFRNALDAMKESGGTLAVSSRLRIDHRIELDNAARGPSVVVDVDDEGCGIPAELRDQVGTPFFTTKPDGTGLGLALCRHFVAQHGGSLQLLAREPRGTRVRVVLPLRRKP